MLDIHGGGLTEHRCHDARGRVSILTHFAGDDSTGCDTLSLGATLAEQARFDYTYDERDNRSREVFSSPSVNESTSYGYDHDDRLTDVTYPEKSVHYGLDLDGSRLTEQLTVSGNAQPVINYHYTDGDLTSRTQGAATVASYQIDNVGRRIGKTENGHSTTYDWNADDRLERVTTDGAFASGYRYDASGLRRAKVHADTSVTSTTWSMGQILVEDGEFYERAGELVTTINGQRTMHDSVNSVVGRFSGVGSAIARFDAWGTSRSGTPANGAGFAGQQNDNEASLSYAQQRWYDSGSGRFLSQDPLGPSERLNGPNGLAIWGYANGSPTRFTDATGRLIDPEETYAGAFFSAMHMVGEAGRGIGNGFLVVGSLYTDDSAHIDENWNVNLVTGEKRAIEKYDRAHAVRDALVHPTTKLLEGTFSAAKGAASGVVEPISKTLGTCSTAMFSSWDLDTEGSFACGESLPGSTIALGSAVAGVRGATAFIDGAGALLTDVADGAATRGLVSEASTVEGSRAVDSTVSTRPSTPINSNAEMSKYQGAQQPSSTTQRTPVPGKARIIVSDTHAAVEIETADGRVLRTDLSVPKSIAKSRKSLTGIKADVSETDWARGTTYEREIPDADAAYEEQKRLIDAPKRDFAYGDNDCVSHVCAVVRKGGVKISATRIKNGFKDKVLDAGFKP